MPRLFAFLRAINAGPGRVVRMNVLRKAFESLGFVRVATFLGSGNVVFETGAKDIGALERKIERTLQQVLGYTVPVFIRTHRQVKEIASLEPFKDSETRGVELNIILLANYLDGLSKAKLQALGTKTNGFHVEPQRVSKIFHQPYVVLEGLLTEREVAAVRRRNWIRKPMVPSRIQEHPSLPVPFNAHDHIVRRLRGGKQCVTFLSPAEVPDKPAMRKLEIPFSSLR